MAAIRRHSRLATVLGGVLLVAALWAVLPTPFVSEARAANPLLESLVAKVNALQASVDDLAEDVAGLEGDGENYCSWSKRLDDEDRWEEVFPYVEDGVTKHAGVLDRETGLVWLPSPVELDGAGAGGAQIDALNYATPDGTCGWRLPKPSEFATLLHADENGGLQLPEGGPLDSGEATRVFTCGVDYSGAWFTWIHTVLPGTGRGWATNIAWPTDTGHLWLVRGPGGETGAGP